MQLLPFCVTALFGGFAAYVVTLFDRGQNFWRLTNYPIGVLSASLATWISQNIPSMHNKLLILGIFIPAIALLLYQSIRHLISDKKHLAA